MAAVCFLQTVTHLRRTWFPEIHAGFTLIGVLRKEQAAQHTIVQESAAAAGNFLSCCCCTCYSLLFTHYTLHVCTLTHSIQTHGIQTHKLAFWHSSPINPYPTMHCTHTNNLAHTHTHPTHTHYKSPITGQLPQRFPAIWHVPKGCPQPNRPRPPGQRHLTHGHWCTD
jgi:hypothetical protein